VIAITPTIDRHLPRTGRGVRAPPVIAELLPSRSRDDKRASEIGEKKRDVERQERMTSGFDAGHALR